MQPVFLRRMLMGLSGSEPGGLHQLTSREEEDPSIALLDAWATVADVLSFYQERIANEGFLRTATERRSVLELARTIGYELNPGVAASTHLTFKVEDRPPPPGMGAPVLEALVPRGTKVQSMPGQGELPQTFETSAELTARPEWNELRPRLTRPQPVSLGSELLYIAGVASGIEPGDRILVTAPPTSSRPGVETSVLEVKQSTAEVALGRTRLDLAPVPKVAPLSRPPALTPPPPPPPRPFQPLPPPVPQPLRPPELPPKRFELRRRPMTVWDVEEIVLEHPWSDSELGAQLDTLRWKPRQFMRHVRHVQRIEEVEELVEVPAPPDVTPPNVVAFFPARDATKVHPATTVTVTFDEAMKAETLVDETTNDDASVRSAFTLRQEGAGSDVPSTVSYDAATATATLRPRSPLESSQATKYTATVSTAATDLAGNPLAAPYSWSFTTADLAAPTVEEVSPPEDESSVAVSTEVAVRFRESMDGNTVNADTFQLFDQAGALVDAEVEYDEPTGEPYRARLVPSRPLMASARYTAMVTSGIKDLQGNQLAARVWSFTTALRAAAAPPAELAVFAFREETGFFGNNAPRWGGLPKPTFQTENPYPRDWDSPARIDPAGTVHQTGNTGTPRTIWVDSQGGTHGGDKAYLERTVPGLERDSWVVFETTDGISPYWVTGVSERSMADYALSSRCTEVTLSQKDGHSPAFGIGNPLDFKVRTTTAHVRSQRLDLVELPVEDPVKAGDVELMLDRMVLGLGGRTLVIEGELLGLPGVVGHEVVTVSEAEHAGGFTTLCFTSGLRQGYVRKTVVLNANVAAATHGETVPTEILGGGDGSQANQRFVLKKPPLTYVSAPTPSGAEATLEVRVDGVGWEEAPALYGVGPRSRAYMVRREDDGRTSVIFGDGSNGARPPTGTENVVASYRSGIGAAGMLDEDKLTLLQTRPLGIQSVNNPLPASGAEEPESRDEARANAPLTVVTMDRVVSTRDVEDFARVFAGIGKAHAVEMRRGELSFVHLTVAAANGDEVATTSNLFVNLVKAIDSVRDQTMPVVVESYDRLYFNLAAEVLVDSRYVPERVLGAVRSALGRTFSFERRSFAQPVTAAEVITVVQTVPGVVATDLDRLYPVHEDQPEAVPARVLSQVLSARPARLTETGTQPAEMLLVNPGGITVSERVP
ncbi:MAG: putative baseplate assembly protein [Actinomycetota bacterium]|nr:putative baseplate assembly protein [Actinomycetota bacterium]